MTVEKQARAASGWPMLFVTLAAYAASIWGMVQGIVILATAEEAGVPAPATGPVLLVGGIVLLIVAIIVTCGFFSLQPGQARVLVLFGNYVGTVRESGFYWVNPFYSHSLGSDGTGASVDISLEEGTPSVKAAAATKALSTKVSLRARTLNGDRLKVNDKPRQPHRDRERRGVARGRLPPRAVFDVDDYPSRSWAHAERDRTAPRGEPLRLRPHGRGRRREQPVDHAARQHRRGQRGPQGASSDRTPRRRPAWSVDDARLTHLAYAPEIAQAMLRRQQAEAVIAARKQDRARRGRHGGDGAVTELTDEARGRPRRGPQGRHGHPTCSSCCAASPRPSPCSTPARSTSRREERGRPQTDALRIDPEVWAAVERWAADEMRSANGQVEWVPARRPAPRGAPAKARREARRPGGAHLKGGRGPDRGDGGICDPARRVDETPRPPCQVPAPAVLLARCPICAKARVPPWVRWSHRAHTPSEGGIMAAKGNGEGRERGPCGPGRRGQDHAGRGHAAPDGHAPPASAATPGEAHRSTIDPEEGEARLLHLHRPSPPSSTTGSTA